MEIIADYLLHLLNCLKANSYVEMFDIDAPTASIDILLDAVAKKIGARLPQGRYDREAASRHLIEKYRHGAFGKFTLDSPDDFSNTTQ
jgi:hypothetical protein